MEGSDRGSPIFSEVAAALNSRLRPAGFDVLGAVNVGAYNRTLASEHEGFRLPELRDERDLVLVVGSTRRIWPLFLRACARAPLDREAHPFDTYSRLRVGRAASEVANELGLQHAIRYSFDRTPQAVAIQRLATLSGVAELAPIGLCVHPAHGPWFSLRAAVLFDVEGPAPHAASPTCSTCSSRPCLAARDEMLGRCAGALDESAFQVDWRAWLAMRDACPVARSARYDEQQIRYHYVKDRSILDKGPLGQGSE